jgi:hypothetical protein
MNLFDAITSDDDTDALEPLLEANPDLEAKNGDGHTPLEHAVLLGATSCAEALLEAGAQPSVARAVIDQVYAAREEGDYPALDLAIYSRCRQLARCLLACGAPADVPETGMHAIHLAAMNGDAEMVGLLLDRGVPVELPIDTGPETALLLATSYGHVEAIALLVKRGADVNAKDKSGKNAEALARRNARVLAALSGKWTGPAADRSDETRAVIAKYRGHKVTADLDGSLFAAKATTFHFFFDDPKELRSFLREEYSDETNSWNWQEVVPVASVSWCDDKSKSFSWIFLDWRDGKTTPAVVVTTTDRWKDNPRAASLDELHLSIA